LLVFDVKISHQDGVGITQGELSVLVGINSKNIRNNIAKLKTIDPLSRIGPDKGGYRKVI